MKSSNELEVIKVAHGGQHVVRAVERGLYREGKQSIMPDPNYMGTGKALCGVLNEGESFEHWKKRAGYL